MTGIPADAVRETWDSIHGASLELAAMIEAHCQRTGEQFDAMVVIPRGGYYPANIVSRQLGFEAIDLLHASIGSYQAGTTERRARLRVGQMPSKKQVEGKDLLIIDEVCETGHTLKFLADYLKQRGAGRVRTGVLHYKPSRSQTGFTPDWHVSQTGEWIVYPWEANEADGQGSGVKRSA